MREKAMSEDRRIGPAGAKFHSIGIHRVDGRREVVHPEKGVHAVVLVCYEDEAGVIDWDKGIVMPHTTVPVMAQMIQRMTLMYPGLRQAINAAAMAPISPGSAVAH